jgi:bifunctional DNA-binding transcriptional regulator/antitoxin component of YhaV-PrlF toxin-antitoxin module
MSMIEITKTGYTRKIDSMGRIGIPIKLRKEYNIEENTEHDILIIKTEDGNVYCAIDLGRGLRQRNRERARRIIHELDAMNVEVPSELSAMIKE